MTEIDLQPVLTGNTIRVRPLVSDDFESLYQAASDPKIWAMHPDSERFKRDIFRQRYFEAAVSDGALVVEKIETGLVVGSSRYYQWHPETKEIAIGYTFLKREEWGGRTNRELKTLMLDHIYQWATLVWFEIGKDNLRSRRAVEKLGATFSHEESKYLGEEPFIQVYYKLEASRYLS